MFYLILKRLHTSFILTVLERNVIALCTNSILRQMSVKVFSLWNSVSTVIKSAITYLLQIFSSSSQLCAKYAELFYIQIFIYLANSGNIIFKRNIRSKCFPKIAIVFLVITSAGKVKWN